MAKNLPILFKVLGLMPIMPQNKSKERRLGEVERKEGEREKERKIDR